jgi:hypothetical protein
MVCINHVAAEERRGSKCGCDSECRGGGGCDGRRRAEALVGVEVAVLIRCGRRSCDMDVANYQH